jgi:hypothetical protein
MRINELVVQQTSSGLWYIRLSLAHGDSDLLFVNDDGKRTCEGNRFGVELCAISEISSNVNKRVQ